MLLGLVLFPESSVSRLPAEAQHWFESLVKSGVAFLAESGMRRYWAAVEHHDLVERLLNPEGAPADNSSAQDPLVALVRGWAEISGPITASALAPLLGFPVPVISIALSRLEGDGLVLRGFFTDARQEEEFCDRRISACDPLNLVGILTPGPRVPAVIGNRIIFRDGVPVAAVESGETRLLARIEDSEQPTLERLLDERPASAFDPVHFTRAPQGHRGR